MDGAEADQAAGRMGEREMRRRAVRQRHLLHEGVDVAVIFGEAVDVALALVLEASVGAALSAPVERRHREAAASEVFHRLEIALDRLGPPLEEADRAERPPAGRPPVGGPEAHPVAGQDFADHGAVRHGIRFDREEFHSAAGG